MHGRGEAHVRGAGGRRPAPTRPDPTRPDHKKGRPEGRPDPDPMGSILYVAQHTEQIGHVARREHGDKYRRAHKPRDKIMHHWPPDQAGPGNFRPSRKNSRSLHTLQGHIRLILQCLGSVL